MKKDKYNKNTGMMNKDIVLFLTLEKSSPFADVYLEPCKTSEMGLFVKIKVMSDTILLFCFLSLKESFFETKKGFFISLQSLFSFLRESNFKILKS